MVVYDFDQIVDRRGTSCLKYDFGMKRVGRDDLLPMWIADMDFKLPPEIIDSMHQRVEHGIFGYTDPDQEYYDALNRWYSKYYGYTVEPETVTVGCGIVYCLATTVKAYTKPGDSVLIQQPVYYPFSEVIVDNGRKLINSPLVYKDNRYSIDFDTLEKDIADNKVKLFLLCNPHNPVGRVWSKEELIRIADICMAHDVMLVSDEIHCDIVYPGHKFTSLLTLGDKYKKKLAVCTSPSKTFNIAGLQPSNIIIPNEEMRLLYKKANAASGYSQGNAMGIHAVKACYTLGDEWYKQLLDYLYSNVVFMRDYVKENFKKAVFVEPEGTYLTWVDFSPYGFSDEKLEHLMKDEAKVWLDNGAMFGPATAQFERFNVACPRSILKKALDSIKEALERENCYEQRD